MKIESVEVIDSGVIRITDESRCQHHYLIEDGVATYGYPYVIVDRNTETSIHLFVPLPSGPPRLLKLRSL